MGSGMKGFMERRFEESDPETVGSRRGSFRVSTRSQPGRCQPCGSRRGGGLKG